MIRRDMIRTVRVWMDRNGHRWTDLGYGPDVPAPECLADADLVELVEQIRG